MRINRKKSYESPVFLVYQSDTDGEILVGSDFESTIEDLGEDDIFN